MGAGEIGFVRHAQPFLGSHAGEMRRAAARIGSSFQKLCGEPSTSSIAAVILENFQRAHPEAGAWRMAEPPGDHPAITAWLAQRITRLWNEKRARESVRGASPKRRSAPDAASWTIGAGVIASVTDCGRMSGVLEQILPAGKPERVLVKVTWHGYATGTYTDPAALDLLLSALPARAIILEGHTSSKNLGKAGFDWETEAREHRAWIRQQDAEYLRRTGLADVMAKHHARVRQRYRGLLG